MCMLCVEFMKGKMTVHEGWKNLSEMQEVLEPPHVEAIEEMLWNAWYEAQDDEEGYQEHGQGD